jgi:hypothetical protein
MQTRVVQPSRPTELEVVIELPSLASKVSVIVVVVVVVVLIASLSI